MAMVPIVPPAPVAVPVVPVPVPAPLAVVTMAAAHCGNERCEDSHDRPFLRPTPSTTGTEQRRKGIAEQRDCRAEGLRGGGADVPRGPSAAQTKNAFMPATSER